MKQFVRGYTTPLRLCARWQTKIFQSCLHMAATYYLFATHPCKVILFKKIINVLVNKWNKIVYVIFAKNKLCAKQECKWSLLVAFADLDWHYCSCCLFLSIYCSYSARCRWCGQLTIDVTRAARRSSDDLGWTTNLDDAVPWTLYSMLVVLERLLLSRSYLVDPASGHMLVSKIKPCMSTHKRI